MIYSYIILTKIPGRNNSRREYLAHGGRENNGGWNMSYRFLHRTVAETKGERPGMTYNLQKATQ